MRVMARSQLDATDRVIDIGSSFGICTNILAKHCRGNVLGVEISADMVDASRERYPDIEFLQLDALEEREKLKEACRGCDKVFLDLGGNRPMESVVTLVPFLLAEVRPKLLVVKNRELGKFAAKHIQDCSGDPSCRALTGAIPNAQSWWDNIEFHCKELQCARESKPPRWRWTQLENHDGAAPRRFLKYALHYKPRMSPDGSFICRYYNYGICLSTSCYFDHKHCHHCGEAGHIAKNCLAGLSEGQEEV